MPNPFKKVNEKLVDTYKSKGIELMRTEIMPLVNQLIPEIKDDPLFPVYYGFLAYIRTYYNTAEVVKAIAILKANIGIEKKDYSELAKY